MLCDAKVWFSGGGGGEKDAASVETGFSLFAFWDKEVKFFLSLS